MNRCCNGAKILKYSARKGLTSRLIGLITILSNSSDLQGREGVCLVL